MARTMGTTRTAGSSGPTDPVEARRNKIKLKVHGKPEDLGTDLILWAEYHSANDMASLTELYKSAPPAIKAKLAELFPTHEVITKNHKGKIPGSSGGIDPDLAKVVAEKAEGDKGKKELPNKVLDKLLKKYDAKDIDKAVEALNEKEG